MKWDDTVTRSAFQNGHQVATLSSRTLVTRLSQVRANLADVDGPLSGCIGWSVRLEIVHLDALKSRSCGC